MKLQFESVKLYSNCALFFLAMFTIINTEVYMNKMWPTVQITDYARLSINPLPKLKFEQKVQPNPDKKAITLQLGDPTIFGNFPPPIEALKAFKSSVDHDTFLYNLAHGKLEACAAVAEYSKLQGNVTADDIVLSNGCSHAMEMCIMTCVAPGENFLIPRPCYNYQMWTDGVKIEARSYNLDPSKNWDIDLKHLESLIDKETRAIVVNNPGNPCGNVFSKKHILEILDVAERHKLLIISDEVYEHMVFPGVEFYSFSSLSKNVPILTCSALSNRFLMPGIRMGWIVIHDRHETLQDVKKGLHNVTGRILGPSSLVQQALPDILRNTPQEFFDKTIEKISHLATVAYNLLKHCPGLTPIMPKGAMYMMIKVDLERFPKFLSCLEFHEGLIREESVLLFPGFPSFNFPGFIRIVLTVPEDMTVEACERIQDFCQRHIKQ